MSKLGQIITSAIGVGNDEDRIGLDNHLLFGLVYQFIKVMCYQVLI